MSISLRRALLIGALAALVVVGFLAWRDRDEERSPVEEDQTPVESPAQPAAQEGTTTQAAETTATGELLEKQRCVTKENGREIKIGDFSPPEGVPPYEVLEDETVERDGAEAVRLLVDTQVKSEAEYTLIARDIKARYEDYDAVTVRFIDATQTLSYDGSALIFNTPIGSCYMGYIYSPPNNEGYVVDAAGA